MNRNRKVSALLVASLLLGATAAYAASSLATVSTTLQVTDPLALIDSVSLDGSACALSGSIYSCTGNVAEGSSDSIVVELTNPGGAAVTVASTTSIPSSCGITATDSTVSVAAGATASLTVALTVAATATIGACSVGTSIVQG